MPIIPKIPEIKSCETKKCARCGIVTTLDDFAHTYSPFYPDHHLPICNSCANEYLRDHEYSWDSIDELCRYAGIPWIVKEWVRLSELNPLDQVWQVYSKVFADQCYASLGWADYNKQYLKLREVGLIEDEIPLVREQHFKELRRKWGENYSDDDLLYLEDLYKGLCATQNVSGALQIDQAQKICKISLEIDSRIRAGDKDIDKFLASYDKIIKTAEFTPKNTKNAVDFDSFAEVGYWLEKRGHQNKFYDDVTRDVIDETMKTIENYNQRLYINEGGIGEEIAARIQSLNSANQLEDSTFGIKKEYDLEEFDNSLYTFKGDEDDFEVGLGEEEE